MPSRSGLVGLLTAALTFVPAATAVACEGDDVRPGTVPNRSFARAVECVVNVQRAQAGLATLRYDRTLARAARRFSKAMVAQRFFGHVSPAGSTLDDRAQAAGFSGSELGETIGWGSGHLATPAAIVTGWMNSPPHRAIILDGGFSRIGLGVASGSPSGDVGAATVTADFGA